MIAGTFFVIAAVALILSVCWLVGRLFGPAVPEELTWADRHGLVLTPATRPWVAKYLRTGRDLRQIGGFGGLIVAASVTAATGLDLHVSGLVWILVGYLVGCVWAELALTRAPGGTRRVASLVPRRLADYLPRHIRVTEVVLPTMAVALGGACVLALRQARLDLARFPQLDGTALKGLATVSPHSTDQLLESGAMAAAVIAPLIMLVVGVAQRYLVGRPQPSLDRDLIAADDALRASSAHLLGASGLSAVCLLIASQFGFLASVTHGFWLAVSSLGVLAGFLGALLIFRLWRNAPWQVRRPEHDAPPAGGPWPPPSSPAVRAAAAGSTLVAAPATTAAGPGWTVRRGPTAIAVAVIALIALAGWGLRTWGVVNPAVTTSAFGPGSVPQGTTRWDATLTVSNEARAPITVEQVATSGMADGITPQVVDVGPDLPVVIEGGSTWTLTVTLQAPWCHDGRAVVPFTLATTYRTQSGASKTTSGNVGVSQQFGDCVDPLPTGPQPVDPAAAEAAVRQNLVNVYDVTVPDRLALIDDPTGVADASAAALNGPFGELAATTTARVDEVSFDRPDHAWLRYQLSTVGSTEKGEATLIDGQWKIARSTVCADIALAGPVCQPPPLR